MEESQEILLNSLANSGVPIPAGVSSIGDLTPATLLWICSQSLRLIDNTSSFPTSLPDSMADQFKICAELASAVTNLGFVGDMSFHKFLYPSEDDLYKLVRFFVEKFSEVSGAGEVYEKSGVSTKATTREVDFKGTSKDCTVKTDSQGVDLSDQEVRATLKNLRLKNEMPWSSISKSEEASVSAAVISNFNGRELTSVENGNKSMEELRGSRTDAYVNEGTVVQEDDRHVLELEQKLVSIREQSSKIRSEIEKLQSQEGVLMEEMTAKTLETQHLEEEHESLKAAIEMVFDDHDPADFYIVQLKEEAETKKQNLVALESQWDILRKSLEEKKRSLEEVLYATKPEAQEKLQKLKGFELEIQSILSEIEKREEECSKLSADLEKQPKLASRRSYIQRITEITKNSGKQDADIERILKETRELQLESNSIQERLHRTYTVVDETVFREAKKDPTARQAYRLLTSIHESFEQISEKILATDRTRREVAEHEARLAALTSRSINIDKLHADLDAIRRENEFLEHHHGDGLNP